MVTLIFAPPRLATPGCGGGVGALLQKTGASCDIKPRYIQDALGLFREEIMYIGILTFVITGMRDKVLTGKIQNPWNDLLGNGNL